MHNNHQDDYYRGHQGRVEYDKERTTLLEQDLNNIMQMGKATPYEAQALQTITFYRRKNNELVEHVRDLQGDVKSYHDKEIEMLADMKHLRAFVVGYKKACNDIVSAVRNTWPKKAKARPPIELEQNKQLHPRAEDIIELTEKWFPKPKEDRRF